MLRIVYMCVYVCAYQNHSFWIYALNSYLLFEWYSIVNLIIEHHSLRL